MLERLLAWYNLIFYIPLALGLLLVVGMATGAHDPGHDVGHDVGHDAGGHAGADGDGHGAEHEGGHGPQGLLALLGFGRVPVMILATTMCLLFGGVGVILNHSLTSMVAAPNLAVWVALGGALLATVVLTGFVSRLVTRLIPNAETDSMSKQDLVGCTGTLILPADERSGLVQVIRGGDVYQVPCRSSAEIPKGTTVLVTDYDEQQRVYGVCPDPTITN